MQVYEVVVSTDIITIPDHNWDYQCHRNVHETSDNMGTDWGVESTNRFLDKQRVAGAISVIVCW